MSAAWGSGPTGLLRAALPKLLLQPRFRAVLLYRASAWCWQRRVRPVAYWLQGRTVRAAGAELHPASRIGPGLCLAHSVGIVVGHEVVAGRDLVLFQGVTLGHGGRGRGQPTLGDRVRIGAGAVVLGAITVGNDVSIGAGAVVLADVPEGRTVVGLWKGSATGS